MNRINIDSELCKGCRYCVTYCPKRIIEIGESFNSMGYKYARTCDEKNECTACAICALMCPDAAINVYAEVKGE